MTQRGIVVYLLIFSELSVLARSEANKLPVGGYLLLSRHFLVPCVSAGMYLLECIYWNVSTGRGKSNEQGLV
jgi:hypothetical protein